MPLVYNPLIIKHLAPFFTVGGYFISLFVILFCIKSCTRTKGALYLCQQQRNNKQLKTADNATIL